MEMLLMGVCLSMFGLAVACLAFGAATRNYEEEAAAAHAVERKAVKAAVSQAHFFVDPAFVDPAPLPVAARTRVPIEVLLLQIENHVRLEQAAAECFLESPNASHLHTRTISALVN
jgi:hypothetical protein